MSSFLSALSCCWFWLLLGGLIGWLLNRWLCKCCCKPTSNQPTTSTPATPTKLDDTPAAKASTPAPVMAAPVAKAAAPAAAAPKAAPKAAATPKPAAPQTAAVIDLAAAKKAGFALKNANDLTVVEGIGPKINELFNNAGVKTFAQLAKQTVPQMRKVLDDGGSRFRIANPSTWAQQAALAAENKWEELKKLQDKLSGGVKK
jgi:predicted flap endonuclease-1-like 5' DNA nuclease